MKAVHDHEVEILLRVVDRSFVSGFSQGIWSIRAEPELDIAQILAACLRFDFCVPKGVVLNAYNSPDSPCNPKRAPSCSPLEYHVGGSQPKLEKPYGLGCEPGLVGMYKIRRDIETSIEDVVRGPVLEASHGRMRLVSAELE